MFRENNSQSTRLKYPLCHKFSAYIDFWFNPPFISMKPSAQKSLSAETGICQLNSVNTMAADVLASYIAR